MREITQWFCLISKDVQVLNRLLTQHCRLFTGPFNAKQGDKSRFACLSGFASFFANLLFFPLNIE